MTGVDARLYQPRTVTMPTSLLFPFKESHNMFISLTIFSLGSHELLQPLQFLVLVCVVSCQCGLIELLAVGSALPNID